MKYGIFAGLAVVLYFLLFYWIDKGLMLHWTVFYGSTLIYVLAMFWAARSLREQQGGQLHFREGLRAAFLTFLVANVFYYLFYYIIYQLDPTLVELQREALREFLPNITTKDRLQQALRDLDERDLNVYPAATLFGYARSAIGGFILAVLIALLARNSDETI